MTPPARRRFPWLWYGLALGLLLVVTLFPIPLLLFVSWFAEANGCTVNEGGIHPCFVNGRDWGTTLAAMGMSGWLLIATLPLLALGLAVWLLVLVIHLLARSGKPRGATP